jgi:hypothetical protein
MPKIFVVLCSFLMLAGCAPTSQDIAVLDAAGAALSAPACKALFKTKAKVRTCRTEAGVLLSVGDAVATGLAPPAAAAP